MAWVRAWLCKLQKRITRLAATSDKVYQLLPMVGGSLRLLPPLKLVAILFDLNICAVVLCYKTVIVICL
jgi:hypothetical protein